MRLLSTRARASDPEEPDEAELVRRIAGKDRHAFDALYRIYHPRLSRFLDQLTHRPHLTQEVLNDTMLVVWRKADTFNGTSQVSTWIFAIAYRKALKALKRLRDPLDPVVADGLLPAVDGPEVEAMRREAGARLRRALAALSVEHRAVVELTFYHGFAYREIAELVGCPLDTVKTRMFHARRRLKSLLSPDDEVAQ
jgi:RNA polymerase sigma-70 factor (ECF subfamily)